MKPLIILTGPTAVGKTALSISLAKSVNGEIISADSMQVYKGLDVGTAKITPEEMQGVPHHLIDIFEPEHPFNVTEFQALAKNAADRIYENGHIPIVAGGTGFYIQALLYGIDFTDEGIDGENLKKKYEERIKAADEAGDGSLIRDSLFAELKEIDPESAEIIGPNNTKRIVRAICYFKLHHEKISEHNKREREKEAAYNSAYFVLTMDREKLYRRIDERIDIMLRDGILDEVKMVRERGLTTEHLSMQAIGYKEFFPYFEGKCTLDEAISQLRLDTKHFAKRQMTWFRREKNVIFVDKDKFSNEESILEYMEEVLKERGII